MSYGFDDTGGIMCGWPVVRLLEKPSALSFGHGVIGVLCAWGGRHTDPGWDAWLADGEWSLRVDGYEVAFVEDVCGCVCGLRSRMTGDTVLW